MPWWQYLGKANKSWDFCWPRFHGKKNKKSWAGGPFCWNFFDRKWCFFLFSNFCYFRMLLYITFCRNMMMFPTNFMFFCLECEQTCYVWLLQKKTQDVFTPHKALKCKIDTLDTRDTQTCPRCLPQNIRIPYSYWKATIFCHNVLLKTNGVQDGATSFLGFLSVQSSLLFFPTILDK